MISLIEVMSSAKMESDLFMDAADTEDLVNQISFTDQSENNKHNNDFLENEDVDQMAVSPHNKANHLPKISPGSRTLDSPICASSPALLRSPGISSLYPLPSPLSMLDDFHYKEHPPLEDDVNTDENLLNNVLERVGNDTKSKVNLEDSISKEEDKITVKFEDNNNNHDELNCDEMLELTNSSSMDRSNNISDIPTNAKVKEEDNAENKTRVIKSEDQSMEAANSSESVVAQVSAACGSAPVTSNSTEPLKFGFVSRRGGRGGRGRLSPPCTSSSNGNKNMTASGRSTVSVDTNDSSRTSRVVSKQGSPHSLASVVSETQSGIHASSSSSSYSPSALDINHQGNRSLNVESHQPQNTHENSNEPRTELNTKQEGDQDNSFAMSSSEPNIAPAPLDNTVKEQDENHFAFPLSPPPSNTYKSNNHLHFPDGKSDLPSALFLSPFSTSSLGIIGDSPFVQSAHAKDPLNIAESVTMPFMSPTLPPTARDRAETETPTNFVNELDKANPSFSWLNSPSIFPLTPKSCIDDVQNKLELTATPTFAASFFAQVQETAKEPEKSTKITTEAAKKVQNNHPYSSMICISPLASSKKQNRKDMLHNLKSALSPLKPRDNTKCTMDIFQEIFASPRPPTNNQNISPSPHRMASLDLNGNKEADSNLNLDVHMAERDLMEDEDLSVLLHLASNPAAASAGRASSGHHHRLRQRQVYSPNNKITPSSLQMPLINNEARGSTPERRNSQSNYNGSQFPMPMVRRRRCSSQEANQSHTGTTNDLDSTFHNNMTTYANSEDKKQPTKRKSSNVMLKPHFDSQSSFPKYALAPNSSNTGTTIGSKNMPNQGGSNVEFINSAPASVNPPHIGQQLQRPPPSGHRMQQHPMSSSQRHQNPANYSMSYDANKSAYPPMTDGMPSQPIFHSHCDNQLQGHVPMSLTPYADQLKKKVPQTKRGSADGGKGRKKQRNDSKGKKPNSLSKNPSVNHKITKENSGAGNFPTIDLAATAASGGKNAQAAALAAAILRGVTMRPSGKWQAQLYYAGKSRYIGVFDSREKAALAYEIAREKLKSDGSADNLGVVDTEAAVKLAREAAFEGVNEPDHRLSNKR